MILKVLTNARKISVDFDAQLTEISSRADSREEKELRRADSALGVLKDGDEEGG